MKSEDKKNKVLDTLRKKNMWVLVEQSGSNIAQGQVEDEALEMESAE